VLKKLLDDRVAQVVGSEFRNLGEHLNGDVLDLLLRQRLVVDPLANVPQLGGVVDPGMGGLLDGRDFVDEGVVLDGLLQTHGDAEGVVLVCAKLLDNLEDISGKLIEGRQSRSDGACEGSWPGFSRHGNATLAVLVAL